MDPLPEIAIENGRDRLVFAIVVIGIVIAIVAIMVITSLVYATTSGRSGARFRTAAALAPAAHHVNEAVLSELQALKREKEAMQRELEEVRRAKAVPVPVPPPAPAKPAVPPAVKEELEKERKKAAALAAEVAKKEKELQMLRSKAAQLEAMVEKLQQAEKKMTIAVESMTTETTLKVASKSEGAGSRKSEGSKVCSIQ
eukprot:tig00020734_g13572.t1